MPTMPFKRRLGVVMVVALLAFVVLVLPMVATAHKPSRERIASLAYKAHSRLRLGADKEQVRLSPDGDIVEESNTTQGGDFEEGGSDDQYGAYEDYQSYPTKERQGGKPYDGDYHELFSLTTRSRKFFPIYFAGDQAYNPNIIPHPTKHDMWIVVAQHEQSKEQIEVSQELMCVAGFLNDVLVCTEEPKPLAIAPSVNGQCMDDLAYLNFRSGPRDARMFNGEGGPLIVYGSQSTYTCLGIWVQDVRMLLDAFKLERFALSKLFTSATEVHRPAPWKGIEKNFFLFWDLNGKAFVHYDIEPDRVFAQLDFDGNVGEDLALETSEHDKTCMAQYMPAMGPEQESIHQATNSLSITMCKRADPGCIPDETNTYVMHIFHHKTYYDFHGVYEPYILLFNRAAPFAMYAISQRPFWIHGREVLSLDTASLQYEGRPASDIPEGHTEMFYVTSMSWKSHTLKYHGYMDDVLLLGFGIEDTRSGAIDVLAGDLLQDLAYC